MSKVAFIFPGQGAQETNMGMDLYENSTEAKTLIDKANDILDFDLVNLLVDENEPINETAYTQPALVAVSVALHNEFLRKCEISPDFVAGLSLGEYSAHVASKSLSFEEAITLVRKRGLFMEEAGTLNKGAMAAIVRGNKEVITSYCDEDPGIVSVANYNSPVQVVISGEEEAVKRVSDRLVADGTRVIPLTVSGAFHSPLMESAAIKFEEELKNITFENMSIPVVTNVTGETVPTSQDIKTLLVQQLKGSVLWEKSIHTMIDAGVDTFVEIGPGKTLAGLVKKINRKVTVYNINSYESIETVAKKIKGE